MIQSLPPQIRCREISKADIDGLVDLLTRGFPVRTRAFWISALKRLSEHPTPPGYPKYGYLLESNGSPVGVLLLIFSSILVDGEQKIRCNVSSWYVEPAFRSHAGMLVSRALKHKPATYINITPAAHTLPILEAQGYVRYCSGQFMAIPALAAWSQGVRVKAVAPDIRPGEDLQSFEIDLLRAHARYGCMSLICSAANRRYPFIFQPLLRRKFGLVRFAQLVYCRDLQDFVRFAGPLGRFLAWRGFPLIAIDSDGPIRGLIGKFAEDQPKYFRGPDRPRLGDLAYSELVMFGP